MYNNQADAFITTAKTVKKVAQKSKSESAVHTVNALTFATHAVQQNEALIEGREYELKNDGLTLPCDLGDGKEFSVFLKVIDDRDIAYVELNPKLAEEVGAHCYQIQLLTDLKEGDKECNKVKAYNEKNVEISAQKFNIQDGQMTEVTPTKTQGRAQ